MPIYAYRCETCGHAKDVIQKFSDTPLSVCPSCGAETFRKQLSAPSFQLKGSGWYVTDFRDNGKAKPGKGEEATPGVPAAGEAAKTESASTDGGKEGGKEGGGGSKPADTPSTSTGATAAPASSSGGSSGGGSDAAPSKPQPTT
jgi:putative FmdB family regulatory protein